MAGLASGNGAQSLAILSQILARGEADDFRREQLERSQASSAAMARIFGEAGLQVDPAMTGTDLANTITAQIAMGTAKRQAEEQARKAREALAERESLGKVSAIRGAVGTELPDVLQTVLQSVPPTGSEQDRILRGDTQGDIRESAARLEMARGAARPFQETRTFDLSPRTGQVGPGKNVSLQDGEDLPLPTRGLSLGVDPISVPPVSLTTVPDNIHALQRRIMTSGELPKPEEASSFFNVPLSQYPGGQKFLDQQNDGGPRFTNFAKDAKGNITPITIDSDPRSGLPRQTRGEVVPGVEAPTKPERAQAHEVLQSLGYVIAGIPDKALPEHRGLTSDQAQRVRNVIGQAEQQVSPQLSASVLSLQIDELDEALKRLDAKINAAKTDRDKLALETQRATLDAERRAMRSALMRYAQPGPLSKDAGTPPPGGATKIDTSRLRDAGVLKP